MLDVLAIRNENDTRQKAIDLNRGVTIHRHPATGMQVFMYKDQPGYYLNAFGKPIPEQMAEQAGFPVAMLRKMRDKYQRMADAKELIEREFAAISTTRDLVENRDGYKLFTRGAGRFEVEDPDGNVLNEAPLPEATARFLLDSMAPLSAGA